MKELGDIIKRALTGIVDVYPQIADFEEEENLPYPFAVYRIDEMAATTKEGERSGQYTVNVVVVSDNYDNHIALTDRVKEAVLMTRTREMSVRYGGTTTDYDEDDRAYLSDITFFVKKY